MLGLKAPQRNEFRPHLLVCVLDGGIVVVDKVVLHILQRQRGLAHSAVAQHHQAIPLQGGLVP